MYLIDEFGYLWVYGDCDNFHWARFEGYTRCKPHEPIWVYRYSDRPPNTDEITYRKAHEVLLMYLKDVHKETTCN